ncbi:MAG: MerR family transcriptional regulator [Pasteurellaceae bacterium]|nr:MerR family transcriptional regulator [Pasteurellaceae bacterium]
MKIQEFSQLIGLTSDTLRYYEKEGLVKPVRDASGHRDYSEQDIEWVKMILRLKETRMPIEKIKRYA